MRSGPRWPRCEAFPAATTTTPASWRPQMVSFLLSHSHTCTHRKSPPFSFLPCCLSLCLPVWLARATDWPSYVATVTSTTLWKICCIFQYQLNVDIKKVGVLVLSLCCCWWIINAAFSGFLFVLWDITSRSGDWEKTCVQMLLVLQCNQIKWLHKVRIGSSFHLPSSFIHSMF